MNQSQEEIRRIIISDMVKKINVFDKSNTDMLACMLRREKRRMKSNSIVPVIGEDEIVCSCSVKDIKCQRLVCEPVHHVDISTLARYA